MNKPVLLRLIVKKLHEQISHDFEQEMCQTFSLPVMFSRKPNGFYEYSINLTVRMDKPGTITKNTTYVNATNGSGSALKNTSYAFYAEKAGIHWSWRSSNPPDLLLGNVLKTKNGEWVWKSNDHGGKRSELITLSSV